MIKFPAQEKAKKKFFKQVIWFFIVLLIIFLLKPTWNIWRKYRLSKSDLKNAELEVEDLKQRQTLLEKEFTQLDTVSGQEKELVKKFDLVKEGEKLAVIIEPDDVSVVEEKKIGFFRKFFERYFGWMFN